MAFFGYSNTQQQTPEDLAVEATLPTWMVAVWRTFTPAQKQLYVDLRSASVSKLGTKPTTVAEVAIQQDADALQQAGLRRAAQQGNVATAPAATPARLPPTAEELEKLVSGGG